MAFVYRTDSYQNIIHKKESSAQNTPHLYLSVGAFRIMPICITCSTPVKNLYTTYSKADDRSLGKGVRLTQCPNCKRFADKYVEHDYVVLFIDLVLIKPQVRSMLQGVILSNFTFLSTCLATIAILTLTCTDPEKMNKVSLYDELPLFKHSQESKTNDTILN